MRSASWSPLVAASRTARSTMRPALGANPPWSGADGTALVLLRRETIGLTAAGQRTSGCRSLQVPSTRKRAATRFHSRRRQWMLWMTVGVGDQPPVISAVKLNVNQRGWTSPVPVRRLCASGALVAHVEVGRGSWTAQAPSTSPTAVRGALRALAARRSSSAWATTAGSRGRTGGAWSSATAPRGRRHLLRRLRLPQRGGPLAGGCVTHLVLGRATATPEVRIDVVGDGDSRASG